MRVRVSEKKESVCFRGNTIVAAKFGRILALLKHQLQSIFLVKTVLLRSSARCVEASGMTTLVLNLKVPYLRDLFIYSLLYLMQSVAGLCRCNYLLNLPVPMKC